MYVCTTEWVGGCGEECCSLGSLVLPWYRSTILVAPRVVVTGDAQQSDYYEILESLAAFFFAWRKNGEERGREEGSLSRRKTDDDDENDEENGALYV